MRRFLAVLVLFGCIAFAPGAAHADDICWQITCYTGPSQSTSSYWDRWQQTRDQQEQQARLDRVEQQQRWQNWPNLQSSGSLPSALPQPCGLVC